MDISSVGWVPSDRNNRMKVCVLNLPMRCRRENHRWEDISSKLRRDPISRCRVHNSLSITHWAHWTLVDRAQNGQSTNNAIDDPNEWRFE